MHHGWNGRRIHSSTFGWLGYRIADADDSDRHRLPDWLDCGRSVPQVYKDEKRSTGKQGGIQRTLQKSRDFADRADGVPVRYADSCELHT